MHSVLLTTPVASGTVSEKFFSGIVQEKEEINVSFREAGQIEHIYVEEGDFVKKGQLLARLDDKDYRLLLQNSEIQYNQMKDEMARKEQLFQQNGISGNDYEKALAGFKQIGIQLEQNRNKVEYTYLYAPVTGYIQDVNFNESEMVNPGTAVFTLLDVNRFEVETDIPAAFYVMQNRFRGFSCTCAQRPGETFPLQLLSINQKANGNQLYRVRLSLGEEARNRLTAGMNVEVKFDIANDSSLVNSFVVPGSSVFQAIDGKSCVWVLNPDSTVNRREIVTDGMEPGGLIRVRSGLKGNERIVKAGANALQDNEKVQVVAEPTSTNVGNII